jgi:hypothetical protein
MGLRQKVTNGGVLQWAHRERSRAEWARVAVTAGLALAVVAQAAVVSQRLWALEKTPSAHFTPVTEISARPSGLRLKQLMAAHLFGSAAEAPRVAAADATSDHWVLSGTLQGATPGSGAAIFGPTATTTRYCVVGDEVAGGFRLTQVFADRVTIERGGESLSLTLPRKLLGQWVGAGPELAAADVEPEPRRPPRGRQPDLSEFAQNNPIAKRALMPLLHRGQSGHWDGMRVRSPAAANYGLQRNDIIREVDGHPVNSQAAQGLALDTLSQGGPVPVTVERDGALFKLEVNFGQSGS